MKILRSILNYLFSKFTKIQLGFIVVLLFCAFIISDSNILARLEYDREIYNLKSQIEYYREKSEDDSRKLNELRSDKENIEKFARENYHMKKENEEIFVIDR